MDGCDSRLPLLALPLAAGFWPSRGGLADHVAELWWDRTEVEAGVAREEVGAPEPFFPSGGAKGWATPRGLWRRLAIPLMIVLGRLHQPATAKGNIFDLFGLLEPADSEGRFCRQVLEYCWRLPAGQPCESPQVQATSTDVHHFIQACRKAYRDLGEEERWLLEPYRSSGIIPEAVLIRDPDDVTLDPQRQPQGLAPPRADGGESKKLSREKLVEVLNESLHASLLSQAVRSPPEAALRAFSALDLREAPRIRSDWAEVGHAVRGSQIVRFDSTSLLPRALFNISMEQLARNEGPAAGRIPVLTSKCAPMSLRSYAAFAERHVQSGKRSAFSFAFWDLFGLEPPAELPANVAERIWSASLEAADAGMCGTVNVNARRLPGMFSLLEEHRLAEALGLEEEVLRTQPYLWLGPLQSMHHYDEHPAVYIQLSGHTDVLLIAQSHTDFYGPQESNVKDLTLDDPLLKRVPVFLIHLRPGDGLVFPGRSYHTFRGQSSGRIALSFFLQPQWRKMEFSKDDWHSREAGKEFGLQHLALRQLFIRSLVRVYEETGKGIFFQHGKNELL